MTTELIKRFILEEKKDSKLYKMFMNDMWYPNYQEYSQFLNKQNKNNKAVSKLINKYHLIKKNDQVIETVAHEDYSISSFLECKSKIIESRYGKIHDAKSIEDINFNTCYLTNGFYENTDIYLHKLANLGSFILAVADKEESEFYQKNYKLLKSIEQELDKRHIKTYVYKLNEHRDKVYALYHRREEL